MNKTLPTDCINPIYEAHSGDLGTTQGGLTKREYFAAKAMQGILSNSGYTDMLKGNDVHPVPIYLAGLSLEIADALIKELNKE